MTNTPKRQTNKVLRYAVRMAILKCMCSIYITTQVVGYLGGDVFPVCLLLAQIMSNVVVVLCLCVFINNIVIFHDILCCDSSDRIFVNIELHVLWQCYCFFKYFVLVKLNHFMLVLNISCCLLNE